MNITTQQQYNAVMQRMRDDSNTLYDKAKHEGWASEKTMQAIVALRLQTLKQTMNPDDRLAVSFGMADQLDDYAKDGHAHALLDPTRYAAAYTLITDITQRLNERYQQQYPIPQAVVIHGYASMGGSPIAYSKQADAIYIDDAYAEFLEKPENQAILTHELAHRYQRSDAQLAAAIAPVVSRIYHLPLNPTYLENSRREEAMCDFHAAQVASPQAVKQMLFNVSYRANVFFIQYVKDMSGLNETSKAVEWYNAKPDAAREAIQAGFNNLSSEAFDAVYMRAMESGTRQEATSPHPSLQHRHALQTVLEAHPDLLLCPSIRFDGSAAILDQGPAGPQCAPEKSNQR